ncbi:RagB/SusD family nutrient uptake outer membrane protein [Arenibacter sp. M-2]|uniref:RagB/SusD family nutrient uptake outer membrane protein n=1 Tax=Arenibacter sp. M-2 TaxID=3053612 RepID=UPI0025712E78|nr:RagB/SusD family nutrient uptake outer membrane protein [Arenibacter sp. M-2]MDL5511276.1 RagB/SusD family nutrient uptake outer membrane protein [Arenibacter sp. M-2]
MKKYILIVYLIAGTIGSCSDDFFDKEPTTKLSSGTFWRTPKDAELGLAGVYSTLGKTPIGTSRIAMLDAISDNGWSQYNNDDGKLQEIANGIITAQTGGIISEMWNQHYSGIAACNVFIKNVEDITMEDTIKNRYKAEVMFLRAQYYFWLAQFFGDVPLILEQLTIETMKQPRVAYADVISAIYGDLDFAIANLPDEAYSGHAVKASALALKARIKLFNGEFSDAAQEAKEIIDDGKFGLYNKDTLSYLNLFSSDGGQKNNQEIIFSVKFLRPDITNNIQERMGRYTAMEPLDNFMDEFETGDLRKTLVLMDTINNTWWPAGVALGTPSFKSNVWQSPTGFGIRKWSPINYDLIKSNWDADIPLMRYAEVLLNYAEAQNEILGPDQSVYDAVNQVRARANLPPLTGLDKDSMRKAIRYERRIEMCFEGQRWMDLKRWNLAGKVIPQIPINFREPNGAKRVWKDAYYYWPVQQNELDKDTNLKQTPGY